MQGRTTGCHISSLQIVRYAKELLLFYIGEAYLDDRELLVEMCSNSYRSCITLSQGLHIPPYVSIRQNIREMSKNHFFFCYSIKCVKKKTFITLGYYAFTCSEMTREFRHVDEMHGKTAVIEKIRLLCVSSNRSLINNATNTDVRTT